MLDRMRFEAIRSRASLTSIVGGALVALLLGACDSGAAEVKVATATATAAPTKATTLSATPTAAPANPVAACVAAKKTADATLFRLVDKQRALPDGYVPPDLVGLPDRLAVPGFPGQQMRRDPADAAVKLLDAAQAQGLNLRAKSAYRSYATQITTFKFWVDLHGLEQAKRESAEPGHSEHQMGTVVDVAGATTGWELEPPFGDSVEGKWVLAHAHEFGFAISYPKDGEPVTGYYYEPWHLRYLGTTCSKAWHDSGMILVKFLEAVAAAG